MISAIFAAAVLFAQAAPAAAPAPADTTAATDPAKPPAAEAQAAHVVSPVTVNGAKPKTAADPNQVVCHKEPVLGSLFPKEVCATRREAAERRQNDQAQVREWVALKPLKVN